VFNIRFKELAANIKKIKQLHKGSN